MSNALVDFYRCPETLTALSSCEELHPRPGYFSFGAGSICYGHSAITSPGIVNGKPLPDLAQRVEDLGSSLRLPFDPSAIIDNLRLERYPANTHLPALLSTETARQLYYCLRPFLGDSRRRSLQRLFFRGWEKLTFPRWPVDLSVEQLFERLLLLSMKLRRIDRIPFIWFWPDGAPSAAMVTHDVEGPDGVEFVPKLLDIDDSFGFKTSFQLVPEDRYVLSKDLLGTIRRRQCEINVHGLSHDGNLFRNRGVFLKSAERINQYVQEFGAEGFRSACMYRNISWLGELEISYDMSVPNVARLEPQRGGCCTVFPYFINGVLELPLTTVQDYSLFHILKDYSIDLWKKQIGLIMGKHGLISFIAHPDYLLTERSLSVYKSLLGYLSNLRREKKVWVARAGDINRWWRDRASMRLELGGDTWRIEGPGAERARIAFAYIDGDEIRYSVEQHAEASAEREMAGARDLAAS